VSYNKIVDAVTPSPERVLDLIVRAENRKKLAWTAWRVLKEAASRPLYSVEEQVSRACRGLRRAMTLGWMGS
jgi:hypothetical protein